MNESTTQLLLNAACSRLRTEVNTGNSVLVRWRWWTGDEWVFYVPAEALTVVDSGLKETAQATLRYRRTQFEANAILAKWPAETISGRFRSVNRCASGPHTKKDISPQINWTWIMQAKLSPIYDRMLYKQAGSSLILLQDWSITFVTSCERKLATL